jgi:histidyl-tRNA synthetase
MALSTQPYKGARDFFPEDKRLQKYMFSTIRKVVERYGYEEYDAPILEPLEMYLAKSGEEIVNEQTYTFEDRGGRRVAIRPEMTPTVSRMVANKRQELAYPLRWYSIPNLWRYERPQRGRLREHWQLNVDIFGLDDMKAEMELIQVADSILKDFGATHDMYTIKVNSRKLMDFIMKDYLKLSEVQMHMVSKLIDRMHKMPPETFDAEAEAIFTPSQRDAGAFNKLVGLLKIKQIHHLPEVIRESEPAKELKQLIEMLRDARVPNVVFDITVMRGFDYYTGIVFEMFDNHPDNNRAMMGGGRYDGLVGLFGVEPVPTVGFGWGDVTLQNFLETHDLLPNLRPDADVYVVLIGDIYGKAQKVINELRSMGANVAVDLTDRKPDKQIKTAVKKGIHYAMFIGEKELRDELYEIKNLQTGAEERHSASRIVSIVTDYRGGKDLD